MRLQVIKRVVDARKNQGRIILHLVCNHNVSVFMTPEEPFTNAYLVGSQTPCEFCPDEEAPQQNAQDAFNKTWGDE